MKKDLFGFKGLFIAGAISSFTSMYAQENKPVINDSIKKAYDDTKSDVDNLKKLKVTGWVQAQYQVAESRGVANYDGGDFATDQYQRFMIRRGRVKFTYNQKLSQYVMQINGSERGVNLVEIFGKVTDPWTKSFSLTMGVMNRPFGFEIQQSSADRETPERSRYVQMLLPNERDLGGMITYQPTKHSKLFGLKVDAGLFNGDGIAVPGTTSTSVSGLVDHDNFKDFIGRAHYKKSFKEDKITLGIGFSHYNGGIAYTNNKVFDAMTTDANGMQKWVAADTSSTTFKGKKAPRVYYAGELQLSIKSPIGTTTIRGEYITGTQSAGKDDSRSPNTAIRNGSSTYVRNFNGGNIYFVQRIGKTKHEIAIKYEWYDPNTKVSAKDFAAGTTLTKGELRYDMLGIGYIHYWDENVKFMVYYNIVQNEKGTGIAGYTSDVKDNIFTVRMQYRF